MYNNINLLKKVVENMKEIYIVLTYTGTFLSRIIKSFTGNEFAHVSIALDIELKNMYSFGRLNPYNPFIGGFVHEYIDDGTFKRFKNTVSKVYALPIEEEKYEKLKKVISEIQDHRKDYTFNIIGLFAAGIHIKLKYNKSFYCAEFVKYCLDKSRVKTDLPEPIKPEDFKTISKANVIYAGLLRDYVAPTKDIINIDDYKVVNQKIRQLSVV